MRELIDEVTDALIETEEELAMCKAAYHDDGLEQTGDGTR
jgi:hypothetical protein